MTERISKKEPIELAWDEFVAGMADRKHGPTDAFKFAWKASKPWVGLTDEEFRQINRSTLSLPIEDVLPAFATAIEAKLKEKNT
jgi:hypothetical protein